MIPLHYVCFCETRPKERNKHNNRISQMRAGRLCSVAATLSEIVGFDSWHEAIHEKTFADGNGMR